MPNGRHGTRFFERLIVLETKMLDIVRFQKWQMVLLAAIFLAALKAAAR